MLVCAKLVMNPTTRPGWSRTEGDVVARNPRATSRPPFRPSGRPPSFHGLRASRSGSNRLTERFWTWAWASAPCPSRWRRFGRRFASWASITSKPSLAVARERVQRLRARYADRIARADGGRSARQPGLRPGLVAERLHRGDRRWHRFGTSLPCAASRRLDPVPSVNPAARPLDRCVCAAANRTLGWPSVDPG